MGALRLFVAYLLWYSCWSYEGWRLSGRLDRPEIRHYFETIFFTEPYQLACMALIALFTLGVWPRVVGWVLLVMLAPWALNIAHSPGVYLTLALLLPFVMLRSDVRYSLPALLWDKSGVQPGPVWPIRLMQLMVTLIYGVNALAKSSPDYLSGDVLMALSTRPNWLADMTDGYLRLFGLVVPVWLAAPASALTEWVLAFGLWFKRWRWWVALLGVSFHYVLTFIVSIGGFDLRTISLYPLFFIPIEEKAE